jgi:hypothetical protein
VPQLPGRLDPELSGDVPGVVLDRVDRDAASLSDLAAGHPVAKRIEDPPLGRREDIRVGRPTATP